MHQCYESGNETAGVSGVAELVHFLLYLQNWVQSWMRGAFPWRYFPALSPSSLEILRALLKTQSATCEEERSTRGIFNKAVPPCSKQQTKRACKSPSKTFQTFHKTRPKHFLKAHGRSPRESLQDCGATFVPLRVVTDLLRSTKVAPQSILA